MYLFYNTFYYIKRTKQNISTQAIDLPEILNFLWSFFLILYLFIICLAITYLLKNLSLKNNCYKNLNLEKTCLIYLLEKLVVCLL
jgi:hypothetical protein